MELVTSSLHHRLRIQFQNTQGKARPEYSINCKQKLLILVQNDLRVNSDNGLHIKYMQLKRNDI